MEFGKPGYTAQIAAYLQNRDYLKAYSLAKEFTVKFPDEMSAHFLLSQSAFWLGRYDEAAWEGSKAFNKASAEEDMVSCAITAASAYYGGKRYSEGFAILKFAENRKKTANIETMLFMCSLAMNNGREAATHLNELYCLNKKAAEEMAVRYLK